MMSWSISVYRQEDGGRNAASTQPRYGERLAVWQAPASGLRWLDELAKAGSTIVIAEGGYPTRYTATGKYILPNLLKGPPQANTVWVCGPEDVIGDGWAGKTIINHAEMEKCAPEEWLVIEAWDES